jgi:prepilin-type N-terminal cleavage/methylation domain-containing protein
MQTPPREHEPARARGFTLIEMLVTMAVIAVLAGLVLGVGGVVQRKGALARAEATIRALSTACEDYKTDFGVYPRNADTDALDPRVHGDPTSSLYKNASVFLYKSLSGDMDADRRIDPTEGKSYYNFAINMLQPTQANATTVIAVQDPFGFSYGYSTANQSNSAKGYNPTFDLWSTSGKTTSPSTTQAQWKKNW